MKTSVWRETHTGNQPIRVVKHNITTRLSERNEEYIKQLQSDFRLSAGIKYHINELALFENQMPFIDQDGVINIHETFLSYTWIICYFFFVLHEEGFAIPDHIRRGESVHKMPNPQLLEEARELFNYGRSLIVAFTPWDKELFANPEYFDEETDEGWYIQRTNDIFVEVLNLILYHESAHAELEHINQVTTRKLSDEERKQLELEADTRAINLIMSSFRSSVMTELAIAIGLIAMIFSKRNLHGGKKHPRLDERLENAIAILNPAEDSSIWPMLSLFLKEWSTIFNIQLVQQPAYDTYKELFYDLLKQAKEI